HDSAERQARSSGVRRSGGPPLDAHDRGLGRCGHEQGALPRGHQADDAHGDGQEVRPQGPQCGADC
ncbi:hypothetical protein H4R21_006571, partial [Coemansia helicoidea]